MIRIAVSLLLILSLTTHTGLLATEIVVPVRVSASSNSVSNDLDSLWHVDTLRLGAAHYNSATGSNAPYGLLGFHNRIVGCVTSQHSGTQYPGHESYASESPKHSKPKGMWMSANGDVTDAWVEFELPEETDLGQLWIWNWNDAPEIGRRVKQATIQTSTQTTAADQLGKVTYDVNHHTADFPNIGRTQARTPDVVYSFRPGTRSRYLRLANMSNYGDAQLGLAEVLIVAGPEEKPANSDSVQVNSHQVPHADEPHWQLFLDDHIITRSTGFQRIVHHPTPQGVVLKPEKPWESFGVTPWYVGERQGGGYECYYQALYWRKGGGSKNQIAYAISDDGIHWKKPVLNMVDGPTQLLPLENYPLGLGTGPMSKENNILPCGHPRDLFKFGNVRDPKKRYAIGLDFRVNQRIGFCSELPDFINDPNWRDKITDSGGYKPSHYNALEYWDDMAEEWVALRQAPNHPPVRCAGRYASPNLKQWHLDHFLYPDLQDSTDPRYFAEVYGLMGLHLEGIVLGMGFWFHGDRTHHNPELYQDGHRRQTTEEGLIGKSVALGKMEVRLVTSRNGGKTWDRSVSRQPWIPYGTEINSYDRQVRLDCPPLHVGDEDWFYASVVNGDHGMSAGGYGRRSPIFQGALYTQKHNRYVSLRAGNDKQILITKPIKVTGQTLQLNVDGSHGEVRVGIGIDRVIPHKTGAWKFAATLPHYMVKDRWEQTHLEKGFHILDCDPIHTDCIQQNVRWKEANLESLLGKTVRLYIMVQDADLYGFRFM